MKAFLSFFLAGQACAAPLFKTRVSSTPGEDVLKQKLSGLSGHFQRLHAATKPNPAASLGVGGGTNGNEGAGMRLVSLPAASAGPVLKFDPSLFFVGTDPENEFSVMLENELAAHAAHPVPSTTFSYVLCGPQATASAAREALTAATGKLFHAVAYASRADSTACWSARLTLSQYHSFASYEASPFFAAAPVPHLTKFGPSLLVHAHNEMRTAGDTKAHGSLLGADQDPKTYKEFRVSSRAFLDMTGSSGGIRIVLHSGIESFRQVRKWTRDGFGLKGDHAHAFFPLANAEKTESNGGRIHPVWARARRAAVTGECPSLLDITVPSDSLTGSNLRIVLAKKNELREIGAADRTEDSATAIHHDHCALLALAYLAAQPEVRIVDIPPHHVTTSKVDHKHAEMSTDEFHSINAALHEAIKSKAKGKPVDQAINEFAKEFFRSKGLTEAGGARNEVPSIKGEIATKPSPSPKDLKSAISLQTGDASNSTPYWDIGVDGEGQYVQVVDTGFDDASCFLREGPKRNLTQVERTPYHAYSNVPPAVNRNLRKVISYTAVNESQDFYQDYEAGHGTHVASIVVGEVYNTSQPIMFGDVLSSEVCKYYVNDFYGYLTPSEACEMFFCGTCMFAKYCDATCGHVASNRTNAYTGVAPGAKVNAFDFGDSHGQLHVPDDYYGMFLDGLNAGAKIHSNSWGSAPPFNYYDYGTQSLDLFMYFNPEQLVLVAAGNEGGVPNISYTHQDIDTMFGDKSIGSPAGAKNSLTVGAAETKGTPDTVAAFSSRGPSNDGRIKPDVCGPGDPVNSARASGDAGLATCGILTMSGTSMATPALAGTAAQIRQFLTEGRHEQYSPAGYNNSNYSTSNPTGALIKAMLIGSTAQLQYGYNSTGSPMTLSEFYGATTARNDSKPYRLGTPTVDFTQGFGHTQLENVLPLDLAFNTFLYEYNISAYTNMSKTYVVNSTATKIDVTLVWTDPPASEYCDVYYMYGVYTSNCLVHDLDLHVYVSGVRKYSNFGGSTSGGTYAGTEDTLNNVEKISLAAGEFEVGDEIAVVVQSHGLPFAGNQAFALVVTGNLDTSWCMNFPVELSDSYGDGWNGNVLYIGEYTFTLSWGRYGSENVCLQEGTYTPYACGGNYGSEVSWSVGGLNGSAVGGLNGSAVGGLNGSATGNCKGTAGSFTVTRPTPAPSSQRTETPAPTPPTSVTRISKDYVSTPKVETEVLYAEEIVLNGLPLSSTNRRRASESKVQDDVVEEFRTQHNDLKALVKTLQVANFDQQVTLDSLEAAVKELKERLETIQGTLPPELNHGVVNDESVGFKVRPSAML